MGITKEESKTMKINTRRRLGLLMAVMMILALMTAPASAAGEEISQYDCICDVHILELPPLTNTIEKAGHYMPGTMMWCNNPWVDNMGRQSYMSPWLCSIIDGWSCMAWVDVSYDLWKCHACGYEEIHNYSHGPIFHTICK
jgi:hypothetical protein